MPQPFPLGAKAFLRVGLHSGGVLDERAQLGETGPGCDGADPQLVVSLSGGDELPPGEPRLGTPAQLLLADVRVEDVELVRGSREAALLELAGHGD